MGLENLHSVVDYIAERNGFIKGVENLKLLTKGAYGLSPYFDGSVAIGYGLDLIVNGGVS